MLIPKRYEERFLLVLKLISMLAFQEKNLTKVHKAELSPDLN